MPFDTATETPAMRRAQLIEKLRSEEPHDREWDFSCPDHCALHTMTILWPEIPMTGTGLSEFFGIELLRFNAIFAIYPSLAAPLYGVDQSEMSQVTPAMVADKLEALG